MAQGARRLASFLAAGFLASCVPASEVEPPERHSSQLQLCLVTGFPLNYSIRHVNEDNSRFLKMMSGRIGDQTIRRKASVEDAENCDVMVQLARLVDDPLRLETFSASTKKSLYWADFGESVLYDRWASAVESLYKSFRPETELYQRAMAERAR